MQLNKKTISDELEEPTAQSRQEIEEMIKYYERLLASYQALLDTLGVGIVAGQGQTGEHEDASEHVLVLTNAHKSGILSPMLRDASINGPDTIKAFEATVTQLLNEIPQHTGTHGYFENNRYISNTPQNHGTKSKTPSKNSLSSPASPPHRLPAKSRPGLIPVNLYGHRLDIDMPTPTPAQWHIYHSRVRAKKICNNLHLRGRCHQDNCEYDHSPINSDMHRCLQHLLRGLPCRNKGNCRRPNCYKGHVCHKVQCRDGKTSACKLTRDLHGVDMQVAEWVKADNMNGEVEVTQNEKQVKKDNTIASREGWPSMVTDLIDL